MPCRKLPRACPHNAAPDSRLGKGRRSLFQSEPHLARSASSTGVALLKSLVFRSGRDGMPDAMTSLMRRSIYLALLLVAWTADRPARAQATRVSDSTEKAVPEASSLNDMSMSQIIDRIVSREHDEIVALRRFRPIIETYIQKSTVRSGESRLTGDFYLLGQAKFMEDDLAVTPLVQRKGQRVMKGQFMDEYDPRGFLQEVYVDRDVFDRDYYDFHFVGREFLGNVHCLVFDISPRRSRPGTAHFRGRIWAEDRDFTIVRFNGKFYPGGRHIWHVSAYAHFDSWRVNVQPGLWLPAYIFNEEMPYKGSSKNSVGFEAQTRLWGYNLNSSRYQGDDPSSSLSVEFRTPVQGGSASAQHSYSPPQAQPNWRAEAETSPLAALERTGRLAAPSDVDEALNGVLNNLEATNHIEIEPRVRCRVLATTSLEILTVGHTIIVSRGLINVVPDETTLAILLAQELGSLIDSENPPHREGFGNVPVPAMGVPAKKALRHFQFRAPARHQSPYGERALAIVRNSRYAPSLGDARPFFEQLYKQSRLLPQLIRPSLANEAYRITPLLESATPSQPEQVGQIGAFPIGARVEVDPWSDKTELLKTLPARLEGTRGSLPFEVTTLMPFLSRYGETAGLSEATSDAAGAAR